MAKFKVNFTGRKIGSIGIFTEQEEIIEVNSDEEIMTKIYEIYEHVGKVSVTKILNGELNSYYVSLVRNFVNCCIEIRAKSEDHVRAYACEYLGKIWCCIYDSPKNMQVVGNTIKVNEFGKEI